MGTHMFRAGKKKPMNKKTHKQNFHGIVPGLSRDCPSLFLRFPGNSVYVFPLSPGKGETHKQLEPHPFPGQSRKGVYVYWLFSPEWKVFIRLHSHELGAPETLRAQILKNFKTLKFSSELEIFKRATRQTPIFCGEFWRSGLKISSEIEIFKFTCYATLFPPHAPLGWWYSSIGMWLPLAHFWHHRAFAPSDRQTLVAAADWNFQARLKISSDLEFFKIWALRGYIPWNQSQQHRANKGCLFGGDNGPFSTDPFPESRIMKLRTS